MVRNTLTFLLMICAVAVASAAEPDPQDHDAHHPAEVASAPKTKASAPKASAAKPRPSNSSEVTRQNMAIMDMQMKNMGEMHQKMMGATTPDERNALQGDNMKMMQESMSMMNMMGGSGMGAGGMGGMAKEGQPAGKSMPGSMEDRVQMMEKRMDMMQMMMQMMMDTQQPAAPPK
jgi:hypothetical protein